MRAMDTFTTITPEIRDWLLKELRFPVMATIGKDGKLVSVQQRLTQANQRSCAYDRAGLGQSDPGPGPRDGLAVTHDLERLLVAADEPGPYILVGHSMAGLYVRLFTARNPDKVAGVVLVDAATPEATDLPQVQGFVKTFSTASRMAAWGASAGLFKPLANTRLGDKIGLPPGASADKRRAFASGPHNRVSADEVANWRLAAEQAKAETLAAANAAAPAPSATLCVSAYRSRMACATDGICAGDIGALISMPAFCATYFL